MIRTLSPTLNLQLYDHLLRFQLFQGLSRAELLLMAGNTKFGFLKETAGKIVVKEGEPCQQLFFLVSGRLSLSTRSNDGGYEMTEQLSAPWLLQPDALFGVQPRYASTYRTDSACHFITLSKDEVLRLLNDFLIIRLNFMNMLSAIVQRRTRQQWRSAPTSLRERFVRFVADHSFYPAGPKQLRILMVRLAEELGDSRLDVSRMLNKLQSESLLQLHRGRIEVPSLERLLQT